MSDDFPEMVEATVGPVLAELGFVLDAVDDAVDEGGRLGSVVYYRSADCKLQIYWSSRAGEINCMIAPLKAQNQPGLYDRSGMWHYLKEFAEKPRLPLEELVKVLRADKANFETREKWLRWLGGQIEKNFSTARASILKTYE
ncbi:hypothetical protein [Mycolicibacterium sp. 050158]|uniref:hypothetical protein n=1 Tax=Mycolicibacterium sp. 050158 TaxID=3090602 RepID=UPI00299EA885|nr:hypothetical protein [Mycolicibacterium sp. 050158]MDX1888602.1 hypothetical protein [Mycolicibacterium sp. 050158]